MWPIWEIKDLKWIFISYDVLQNELCVSISRALARRYKTRKFRKTSMKWTFVSDSFYLMITPKISIFHEENVNLRKNLVKIALKRRVRRDVIMLLFMMLLAKMCEIGTKMLCKNPTKCLWRWEPNCRYHFFFSLPAHLCAVTYMTEISLNWTLINQSHSHVTCVLWEKLLNGFM